MSVDIDERKVAQAGAGLWLGWTLATALGLIIGYLPSALLIGSVDLGLARILVPLLAGLLIGVAQWLVLRRYLTDVRDWMINLAGSWVVGYALGLFILDLLSGSTLGAALGFIIFGVIVAVFQYPVLRREIPHIWLWILANVAGWGLGAYISHLVIAALFGSNPASLAVITIVNMAVTGLVAGLVTGLALMRIVREPERVRYPAVRKGS